MKLTEKQKRFADYYIETGNATEAYKRVYKSKNDNTAAKEGFKLLNNPKITPYIEERNKQLDDSRIAGMKEVKEFWTNTMRNEEAEHKDRLKASEYIAKTNGAFVDKTEHSGSVRVENKYSYMDEEERKKAIAKLQGMMKK